VGVLQLRAMSALLWAAILQLAAVALASSHPGPSRAQEPPAPKNDAELLLAFKSTFSNGARLGWRGNEPCNWARVKCSNGRVTELLLEGKGLMGSIPHGGWALPNSLLNLDLDGCRLAGSIPPDFALPEGLLKLELDRNNLTGHIPPGGDLSLTAFALAAMLHALWYLASGWPGQLHLPAPSEGFTQPPPKALMPTNLLRGTVPCWPFGVAACRVEAAGGPSGTAPLRQQAERQLITRVGPASLIVFPWPEWQPPYRWVA
jgi:hypothetical protein